MMPTKPYLGWAAWALVAVAVVSAACGTPAQTGAAPPSTPAGAELPSQARVANGRYVTAVALDDGTMTVTPAPKDARPGLDEQQARQLFGSDEIADKGSPGDNIFGFGLVSIAVSLTPGHTRIHEVPAWVGFVWGQSAIPCPSPPFLRSKDGKAPSRPDDLATVDRSAMIFGGGLKVLEYESRGSSLCGGPITGPTVKAGIQHRSLPWRIASVEAGNVTINYQTPACANVDAAAVGMDTEDQTTTIQVQTYVAYSSITCPQVWRNWPIGPVPHPADLIHAPTGPIEAPNIS